MQARAERAMCVGTIEKLMLDNRYHNLFGHPPYLCLPTYSVSRFLPGLDVADGVGLRT